MGVCKDGGKQWRCAQVREAQRERERFKALAENRERAGQSLEAGLQEHMAACVPRAAQWAQREAALLAEAAEARKAAATARSVSLSLFAAFVHLLIPMFNNPYPNRTVQVQYLNTLIARPHSSSFPASQMVGHVLLAAQYCTHRLLQPCMCHCCCIRSLYHSPDSIRH